MYKNKTHKFQLASLFLNGLSAIGKNRSDNEQVDIRRVRYTKIFIETVLLNTHNICFG